MAFGLSNISLMASFKHDRTAAILALYTVSGKEKRLVERFSTVFSQATSVKY